MARTRRQSAPPAGPPKRRALLEERLRRLAPLIPRADLELVLDHCTVSRPLRALPPGSAVWLAAVAHIRHRYTEYERLLDDGYGAEAARHFTGGPIDAVLAEWGAKRRVGG